MCRNKAIERLLKRMYSHYEKSKGRIPDGKSTREMEKTVVKVSEAVERKRAKR